MKKPEIMSPAGHWPQLRAAVEAGADSVYFGLKHFSARAKVGFSLEELPDVIRTLHLRGVRGYLTFNTLVFEHELAEAARTIAAIAAAGTDALIVQDAGILRLAHEIAPALELHASTQMSITDAEGVRFAQSLGAHRVTLARELTLKEIASIHEQTGCELEMFVHGALCVAYSGQCFSSEAWGGRSANRGQCAQACRLAYDLFVDGQAEPLGDARYLLSPGDLYTLKEVPAIIATGISALKIEGRYKDAEYVALTTAAYRKAVDEAWAGRPQSVTRAEELNLEQVYSRGLGPWFINGTNHQTVVRGRAPRHRGVLIARVVRVGADFVQVEPVEADEISPLREGDGVVFDAADWRSPGEPEEGGRLYEVDRTQHGVIELRFANHAVRFDRIRAGDLVWRTAQPDLDHVARRFTDALSPVHRQTVTVTATGREGEALVTNWVLNRHPGIRVTVVSAQPLGRATNHGLTAATLVEQFARLGNTPYELDEVTFDSDVALFCPVSILNQIRRDAAAALQMLQTRGNAVTIHDPLTALAGMRQTGVADTSPEPVHLHLLVRTPEQLDAAVATRPASITLDYLDLFGLRGSVTRVRENGIPVRVASPRILKQDEARIVNFLASLDCGILVRSTGILNSLKSREHGPLTGDFSLNAANSLSAHEYLGLGLDRLTPTHDLNADQIAKLATDAGAGRIEALIWQHLPVFHTEHCVFCRFLSNGTSYKDCGRPCETHRVELRDQTGRRHPVVADVGCRNTVFGAEAQEASLHLDLFLKAGIRHFRLEFVHEAAAEVTEITGLFQRALAGVMSFSQLNRDLKSAAPAGTTQGSLFVPANYAVFPILN